jgi:7-keto-8-aminopelargonate synthetase-like enzyme
MKTDRATRHEHMLRTIEDHIGGAADAGLCRAKVHDPVLAPGIITVDGRRLVNFGSCAYMGLNIDPRLKEGAIAAVERFGPVYSSSPVYTSVDLYDLLEERLGQIFDLPVVVPTTTTLGHLGALPVLVTPDDAVLIDHQAHATMYMATQLLGAAGTSIKVLAHNDMDALEAAVVEAEAVHPNVWYLADGVYSMMGDVAPVREIAAIQAAHPTMWLYYDDAHGFGWQGTHGRGHVLAQTPANDRMVVAVSLSKSFGSGGAAIALPDVATVRRLQVTGSTFCFSGPLHPAELGAAIASAEIHLSPEQGERSRRLIDQIGFIQRQLAQLQLPVSSLAATPIWFVRIGAAEAVIELSKRLMADGFYVNPSAFPAVPLGEGGVRFTNTLYHTEDQIVGLLDSLARHVPELAEPSERDVVLT